MTAYRFFLRFYGDDAMARIELFLGEFKPLFPITGHEIKPLTKSVNVGPEAKNGHELWLIFATEQDMRRTHTDPRARALYLKHAMPAGKTGTFQARRPGQKAWA